jgi:hypothetical protein
MFMLVARRYERASLIVTSNKPFSAWGEIFGDDAVAIAMVDRLVHHAELLSLKGDSYRLRDRDLGARPGRDLGDTPRTPSQAAPPIARSARRYAPSLRDRPANPQGGAFSIGATGCIFDRLCNFRGACRAVGGNRAWRPRPS